MTETLPYPGVEQSTQQITDAQCLLTEDENILWNLASMNPLRMAISLQNPFEFASNSSHDDIHMFYIYIYICYIYYMLQILYNYIYYYIYIILYTLNNSLKSLCYAEEKC